MARTCLRWTVDTERAFVLALKQTGEVRRAAAAIGRSPGICYKRRTYSADFAAAWDGALKEMEAERHAEGLAAAAPAGMVLAPSLTRTRTDGWTQQRRRQFLRALADTGRYGEAAARIGLSYEAVRAFRARSPEFQAMCDKALIDGGTTVEEAAYVRAVEGWEEPVIHNGQVVGYRRRFSDVLAKTLLERREGAPARAPGGRCAVAAATPDEIDRELMRRLEALTLRRKREEKAAMNAWAEDMRRKGWAP